MDGIFLYLNRGTLTVIGDQIDKGLNYGKIFMFVYLTQLPIIEDRKLQPLDS